MARDSRVEQKLDRGGYKYRYIEGYDLSRIDWLAEEKNPARLGRRKDEERIDKISLALKDGVDFPAIVVFLNEGPRDSLATGMHRGCGAKKADVATLDAYGVEDCTDPYLRELLPRILNDVEGVGQTHAEDMAHIAELVRQFPDVSQTDLAAAFGVRQTSISEYMRLVDHEKRAVRLGIGEDWAKISQVSIRRSLARITNDAVFAAAVQTMRETRAVGQDAEAMIDAARSARTEAQALKKLEDQRQRHALARQRSKATTYGNRSGKKTKKPGVGLRWINALRRLWHVSPLWDARKVRPYLDTLDAASIGHNLLHLREVQLQVQQMIDEHEARLRQSRDAA